MSVTKETKEMANHLGNAGDSVGNILVEIIGVLEDLENKCAIVMGGSTESPSDDSKFLELRESVSDLFGQVAELKLLRDADKVTVPTETSSTKSKAASPKKGSK